MDARSPLRDERGQLWRGGTAKFFIDGVVETGTAWLYEPDTNGGGTRAVLARPGALRGGRSRRFARAGFAVHDPRRRRPRRARRARRLPRRRPAPRRHAPHRAHRDAAATTTCRGSPPRASPRRCSRCTWSGARPTTPTRGAARSGPERSARAFRTRDMLRTPARSCCARLRLAGGAVRPAPRHGLGAAAPRAGPPASAASSARAGADRPGGAARATRRSPAALVGREARRRPHRARATAPT